MQDSCEYVGDLVKPALDCFTDSDQRIRYYACEALYNICKVTRSSVLAYFNEIFDGLCKVWQLSYTYLLTNNNLRFQYNTLYISGMYL